MNRIGLVGKLIVCCLICVGLLEDILGFIGIVNV